MLEERRKGLQIAFQQTSAEQAAFSVSTQAALAGAIVYLKCLPEKLNPVVKPLMESIKREENLLLQELSCEFLVQFMAEACDKNPSPNGKLLTNLCTLLKSDTEFTPKIVSSFIIKKKKTIIFNLISSLVKSYALLKAIANFFQCK